MCRLAQTLGRTTMIPAVSRARTSFSNMPDEVFDQWLREAVADRGWPFDQVNIHTSGTIWGPFFLNKPISYWSALNWTLKTCEYGDIQFDQKSIDKACAIVESDHFGRSVFSVPIENSSERLQSCVNCIASHGSLPKPIVCCTGDIDEWTVIDGHHRLAALIGTCIPEKLDSFKLQVWLARNAEHTQRAA